MDDLKRELVDLLVEDARLPTEDLARMVDASEDEVERAVGELEDSGVVAGYQAVVDWSEVTDDHVEAYVEVNVSLDRETNYDEISRRIAGFPEVRRLTLVSGNYDFGLVVVGDSMNEVSRFVSDKVAPIPEITQTVTHFVMETYKDGGLVFDDAVDDDRLSISP
ncbi:MAG: Lrp/AsnC family transcriptional regulator [Halobacteriales archaeon]